MCRHEHNISVVNVHNGPISIALLSPSRTGIISGEFYDQSMSSGILIVIFNLAEWPRLAQVTSRRSARSDGHQVRYGNIRRSSASPRPPCDGTPSASVWSSPRQTPGPSCPYPSERPSSGHRPGRRQTRHARILQIGLRQAIAPASKYTSY